MDKQGIQLTLFFHKKVQHIWQIKGFLWEDHYGPHAEHCRPMHENMSDNLILAQIQTSDKTKEFAQTKLMKNQAFFYFFLLIRV